jgi:hypothetical protein
MRPRIGRARVIAQRASLDLLCAFQLLRSRRWRRPGERLELRLSPGNHVQRLERRLPGERLVHHAVRHVVLEIPAVLCVPKLEDKVRGDIPEHGLLDVPLHLVHVLVREREPQAEASRFAEYRIEGRSLKVLELVREEMKRCIQLTEHRLLDS